MIGSGGSSSVTVSFKCPETLRFYARVFDIGDRKRIQLLDIDLRGHYITDLTQIINKEEIIYTAESKVQSEVMLTLGQSIISIQVGDVVVSFLANPCPGFKITVSVDKTGNLAYN